MTSPAIPGLPKSLLASRFVFERELGRGGMATVYLARETTHERASLGYALARAGKTTAAREILESLEAPARDGYVSPVAFATINLGLGDVDRALDWAEQAYAERRGWLCYLRVNPLMDPLRRNPRFSALMSKMRLV